MAVNRFVLNNISYHGAGAIKEIPGEIARRGYKKVFVCAKVTDLLTEAGIDWCLYSEIKPNPTIQNVKDGVKAYKESGAGLTAATGMDALTHTIKGYTTKGAWELSDMFHREAIKLISENLRGSVAEAEAGQPGSPREATLDDVIELFKKICPAA